LFSRVGTEKITSDEVPPGKKTFTLTAKIGCRVAPGKTGDWNSRIEHKVHWDKKGQKLGQGGTNGTKWD
jgi:hypothetical protein